MTISPTVSELFDEFVDDHVSGRRPDVRSYLARAGARDRELGNLIDRFLEVAPIEPADDATVAILNARIQGDTPLLAARTRLGLKVDDVVARLRDMLGLPDRLRPRLRVAYQELEGEQLDPAGVDDRVWRALEAVFGFDPRQALNSVKRPAGGIVFARAADFWPIPAKPAGPRSERKGRDEVDRLFRGTSL